MNEYRTADRVVSHASSDVDVGLRQHMSRVYGLMSVGMAISAVVAYFVGTSSWALAVNTGGLNLLFMFLPLGMIFAFGPVMRRASYNAARLFFFAFTAAMGMSLSYIFLVYNIGSIVSTFATTSVTFLAMSLFGYTTKRDLSGWGRFLMMGLIGIIAASLLNLLFIRSLDMNFAISIVGVLLFSALTAYDTQNIKNLYLQMRSQSGEAGTGHLAIMGALSLYLDFINLFTFLLSFLGGRE